MTAKLSLDSSRRLHAQRFAAALRRAMKANDVGQVRLARAMGSSSTLISNYRLGHNLPNVETAARLAEILGAEELVDIARAGRTVICDVCGAGTVVERGSVNRRYCSKECERVRVKSRQGVTARDRAVTAERSLAVHRDAVALYCHTCEPEGVCRNDECPLRSVSPLPIGDWREREIRAIAPRMDPHGERWLVAIREANARRWTDEERKRQSAGHRARHAAMTPVEREAWVESIRVGRRRAAEEKTA